MYLEIGSGGLTAVCTDGHRLGIYNSAMDGVDLPQVIIPMATVLEVLKILVGNGNVSVSIADNFIAFSIDGVEIVSKVIDGKFPDFQRIIPTQNDQVATASKESLLDAITKASALADVKTNGMLLNFKSGILSLSCKTSDGNESSNEIDVDYGGADIDLGVNVQYIKDAIAAIPSDTVSIKLRDGTASLLIEGDGNLRCIVMPMRI
jgi:DNA polymerase-3 subunit beta